MSITRGDIVQSGAVRGVVWAFDHNSASIIPLDGDGRLALSRGMRDVLVSGVVKVGRVSADELASVKQWLSAKQFKSADTLDRTSDARKELDDLFGRVAPRGRKFWVIPHGGDVTSGEFTPGCTWVQSKGGS